MSDKTFLDWPFLEQSHKTLANDLDTWAAQHINQDHGHSIEAVDAACCETVKALAAGGWLQHSVAMRSEGSKLDVRSLCLIRETLARHSGLADFAFCHAGAGQWPDQFIWQR